MILICTSKVDVQHDPTNGDVPPQVALTFAADTFGLDPAVGPVPTASLSVTLDAAETEHFAVGTRHVLRLDEAPTLGTAEDAFNQARADDGVTAKPARQPKS